MQEVGKALGKTFSRLVVRLVLGSDTFQVVDQTHPLSDRPPCSRPYPSRTDCLLGLGRRSDPIRLTEPLIERMAAAKRSTLKAGPARLLLARFCQLNPHRMAEGAGHRVGSARLRPGNTGVFASFRNIEPTTCSGQGTRSGTCILSLDTETYRRRCHGTNRVRVVGAYRGALPRLPPGPQDSNSISRRQFDHWSLTA